MTPHSTWCGALVVATVAWGVLAFGGVYGWAFWPLLVAASALGVHGLLGQGSSLSRGLTVAMAAVAAAIIVQLIPIPSAAIASISPATARVLHQYNLPYATGVSAAHPLSIAPAHTLVALVSYGGCAGLLLGVARQLDPSRLRTLMRGLIALGALVAFIGIVQEPLYEGRVYGVWAPESEKVNPFGPFINRNHFAGWMLMLLPLSLGYLGALTSARVRARRWTWRERVLWLSSHDANEVVLVAFACIAMALSLAMTRSKSGIGGFVVAMLMVSVFVLRPRPTGASRFMASAYLLLLLVLPFWLADPEAIAARFVEMDRMSPWELAGRLEIWRFTTDIVRDFPVTGTGLGTFGVATLFYDPQAAVRHYAQAHNDYLQLAAEGGLLVGVPVAAAVVMFVRDTARRFRPPRETRMTRSVRMGAVIGVVAVGVQATVDFSLQVPGNTALFCVVCAIAMHSAVPPGKSPDPST